MADHDHNDEPQIAERDPRDAAVDRAMDELREAQEHAVERFREYVTDEDLGIADIADAIGVHLGSGVITPQPQHTGIEVFPVRIKHADTPRNHPHAWRNYALIKA